MKADVVVEIDADSAAKIKPGDEVTISSNVLPCDVSCRFYHRRQLRDGYVKLFGKYPFNVEDRIMEGK